MLLVVVRQSVGGFFSKQIVVNGDYYYHPDIPK